MKVHLDTLETFIILCHLFSELLT